MTGAQGWRDLIAAKKVPWCAVSNGWGMGGKASLSAPKAVAPSQWGAVNASEVACQRPHPRPLHAPALSCYSRMLPGDFRQGLQKARIPGRASWVDAVPGDRSVYLPVTGSNPRPHLSGSTGGHGCRERPELPSVLPPHRQSDHGRRGEWSQPAPRSQT